MYTMPGQVSIIVQLLPSQSNMNYQDEDELEERRQKEKEKQQRRNNRRRKQELPEED